MAAIVSRRLDRVKTIGVIFFLLIPVFYAWSLI